MIITTANQKGGSGKTTTAAAIISGATYRGKTALGVDLDSQANLTFIMGADMDQPGAYELITQGRDDVIQHTDQGDIIAGSLNLAAADSTLTGAARVYALRDALSGIAGDYDVVVIDTPPALGTMLISALTAADGVIIPLRAKITNMQGFFQLIDTIRETRAEYNPDLMIMGALFTEYVSRTRASREIADAVRKDAASMDIPVFNTVIRQGVAVDEAQIMRQSIFTYAPNSNPAKDYAAFLDEIGI